LDGAGRKPVPGGEVAGDFLIELLRGRLKVGSDCGRGGQERGGENSI
jgi:hypothetical protein